MFENPIQPLLDWLSKSFDTLLATLNPVNLITSLAVAVADMLPAPPEGFDALVSAGLEAIDTVIKFIGLADYLMNLPVWLTAISIILAIETGLLLIRTWRIVRSFVT